MDLANLHLLPTEDKLKWLRSPEGLEHLSNCLSAGMLLKDVAQMLEVSNGALYRWRKYPDISEKVMQAGFKEVKQSKPDLSRDPAYRIICGLDYNGRGRILNEYCTALELWQTPFIKDYFKSYRVIETNYYADYIVKLTQTGRYQLSNTFTLCYCDITCKGSIRLLKAPLQDDYGFL